MPREVKDREDRVALTPAGARELVSEGHQVVVERGAGDGSNFYDDEYRSAGAEIVGEAEKVWTRAELVLKVKEPVPDEYGFLRDGLTLFTYLHLAANRPLTLALAESRTTAIAYETIVARDGSLPLLTPMSEMRDGWRPSSVRVCCSGPAGGPGCSSLEPPAFVARGLS